MTRSNSLRRDSPPTPHLGHSNHIETHQHDNGYIMYSQYSSESETAADFSAERYRDRSVQGEDLDMYTKDSCAAKQNGHVVKMKPSNMYFAEAKPLKSDSSRFLPDYHPHVETKSKLNEYGGLKLDYQRAPSGSSLDYIEPSHYTPSRSSLHSHCSRERLEFSDSDWGKGDYDKRPKSSYINPTSPQPAMRQRSRSGSGLQDPVMPYGASAFKSNQHGHSYSSYTYPRLSETATGIPKVNLYRSFSTLWSLHCLELNTYITLSWYPDLVVLK